MRALRSWLFTPGNNLRMLQKAGHVGADAVIVDLEDAVPMADKETARWFLRDALPALAAQRSSAWVRVNSLSTGLAPEDIRSAVRPGLEGIVLPKTESADDLRRAAALAEEAERAVGIEPGTVRLVPLLETARGVAAAREVAAADSRVAALAFGGVDFCRDMRIELTSGGEELDPPRARIALMARAAGVLAVDTPWIEIHDRDGLVRHARAARQRGFHGKLLIHPNQAAPVNEVFSPDPGELARARRIVERFEAERARGAGAISLDGKMIDEANYRQARDLIAFQEAISG